MKLNRSKLHKSIFYLLLIPAIFGFLTTFTIFTRDTFYYIRANHFIKYKDLTETQIIELQEKCIAEGDEAKKHIDPEQNVNKYDEIIVGLEAENKCRFRENPKYVEWFENNKAKLSPTYWGERDSLLMFGWLLLCVPFILYVALRKWQLWVTKE